MIELELIQDGVILIGDDGVSCVGLNMKQLETIVAYAKTRPTDKHGWNNWISNDGELIGNKKCPCHDLA